MRRWRNLASVDELDALIAPVIEKYEATDPTKVDQLRGAVATVKMVVEQLEERAGKPDDQGAQ